MLSTLEPVVRTAVMSILSALYESGIVKEVALTDVLRLFGADDSADFYESSFSFNDPEWIQAYIEFKEMQQADPNHFKPKLNNGDEFAGPDDLSSDRKLH